MPAFQFLQIINVSRNSCRTNPSVEGPADCNRTSNIFFAISNCFSLGIFEQFLFWIIFSLQKNRNKKSNRNLFGPSHELRVCWIVFPLRESFDHFIHVADQPVWRNRSNEAYLKISRILSSEIEGHTLFVLGMLSLSSSKSKPNSCAILRTKFRNDS